MNILIDFKRYCKKEVDFFSLQFAYTLKDKFKLVFYLKIYINKGPIFGYQFPYIGMNKGNHHQTLSICMVSCLLYK